MPYHLEAPLQEEHQPSSAPKFFTMKARVESLAVIARIERSINAIFIPMMEGRRSSMVANASCGMSENNGWRVGENLRAVATRIYFVQDASGDIGSEREPRIKVHQSFLTDSTWRLLTQPLYQRVRLNWEIKLALQNRDEFREHCVPKVATRPSANQRASAIRLAELLNHIKISYLTCALSPELPRITQ